MTKTCTRCLVTKPRDEFYDGDPKSGFKDGKHTRCKSCHNQVTRDARVRRQFGMSSAELEERRTAAEGCAICGVDDVSHADHKHGDVGLRGFLCQPCNMALGLFNDDPDRLRSAAEYLEHAAA